MHPIYGLVKTPEETLMAFYNVVRHAGTAAMTEEEAKEMLQGTNFVGFYKKTALSLFFTHDNKLSLTSYAKVHGMAKVEEAIKQLEEGNKQEEKSKQ